MSRWPLRRRVAVAAAAAIVLAVAGLGAGVQTLLGRQLRASLDSTLRARAADVSRLSASAPGVITQPGALESSLGGRSLDIEVFDRHGALLSRSLALGVHLLPARALVRRAVAGHAAFADVTFDGRPARLFAAPLPDLGGGPAAGGAVVVAASTADIDETLDRLRLLVVAGASIAAVVAAAAAALLARRALRPLERLTQAAAGIEATGDPSQRLPASSAGDEVGALSQTLNRMLAALERAQERERRFVADASHELRTPLTALRGNADYVARHGADPAVLADLRADAARLSRLVDDLLALAREDASPPPSEPVALVDLARAAAARDANARVSADGDTRVRGDAAALERALANLVENARRYGPADGVVRVDVRRRDGRVELAVSDAGPGLEVPLEQAVQRFWRGAASAQAPGSGLGLALVAATAARHGGSLRVEGSTFTLSLPALRQLSDGGGISSPMNERKDPS